MAIEKMKLVTVTGREDELEKILANSILKVEIQLEDASKTLEKGWKVSPYPYDSSINEIKKNVENIIKDLGIDINEKKQVNLSKTKEEISKEINDLKSTIRILKNTLEEKQRDIINAQQKIEPIKHLKNINVNLEELFNLEFMRFRFGKIDNKELEKIKENKKNLDALLLEVEKEENVTWIVYVTTITQKDEIDSYFNVMGFERIWLEKEFIGNPQNIIDNTDEFIQNSKKEIEKIKEKLQELKEKNKKVLLEDLYQIELIEKANKIKKYLARDNDGAFYLVGWVSENQVEELKERLKKEKVECVIKNDNEVKDTPPTKLKNNNLVKPFEMIVKMYGTPNYKEQDPTTLVAITAFIMFGFMFGDVGQGAVILLIGLILKKKKISLGPVFTMGGISAIIFGFLYGSIFGKEGIIKGILPSPMDNITNMLIAGIATGAIFILIAMIFNIKNGIKNKDKEKIFLDKNGLAGLIFYTTVLIVVVGFLLKGKMVISLAILLVLLIAPLVLILFKDKILKKKEKTTLLEGIFELIETLLSFASNTISFVRLAAFAINHVGLCMAVYILADMIQGAGGFAVGIIGNIIVIGLEGLIVAIQVLRLEYYELFSRFYEGDGIEFKPIQRD